MSKQTEARVRVSKKYTLYIPKAIAEAVGLKERSYVWIRVEGSKLVLKLIPDPFYPALRSPKFAETTFEELEIDSEEMQRELYG